MDMDDEVRDRATYFKIILEQQVPQMNSQYILNCLQVSLSSLEKSLHAYTLSACEEHFDLKTVPLAPVQPISEMTTNQLEGPTSQQKRADTKPTATR